jgi:hypothetical protein
MPSRAIRRIHYGNYGGGQAITMTGSGEFERRTVIIGSGCPSTIFPNTEVVEEGLFKVFVRAFPPCITLTYNHRSGAVDIPVFDLPATHITPLSRNQCVSGRAVLKDDAFLKRSLAVDRDDLVFHRWLHHFAGSAEVATSFGVACAAGGPANALKAVFDAYCERDGLSEYIPFESFIASGSADTIMKLIPNKVGWFGSRDGMSVRDAINLGSRTKTSDKEIENPQAADRGDTDLLELMLGFKDEDDLDYTLGIGLASSDAHLDSALGIVTSFGEDSEDDIDIRYAGEESDVLRMKSGVQQAIRTEVESLAVGTMVSEDEFLICSLERLRQFCINRTRTGMSKFSNMKFLDLMAIVSTDQTVEASITRKCAALNNSRLGIKLYKRVIGYGEIEVDARAIACEGHNINLFDVKTGAILAKAGSKLRVTNMLRNLARGVYF